MLKGSRAIGVLGIGKNLAEALKNSETKIKQFHGPLFYQTDIGSPELIKKRIHNVKNFRRRF